MEQLYGSVEIVDDLLLRRVIGIAMSLKSADTGAVLVPLVLPEVRIITLVVFPKGTHFVQEISSACIDEDQRYIAISPVGITKLVKTTITVIGPVHTCQQEVQSKVISNFAMLTKAHGLSKNPLDQLLGQHPKIESGASVHPDS